MRNFLTVLFIIFLLLPMRVMADDEAETVDAPVTAITEITAQ